MATIEYSDGTKIEFSGDPTQQDAENAYNQVKGIKSTPIAPIEHPQEGDTGLQGVATGLAKGELKTASGLANLGDTIGRYTAGPFVNLAQGKGFTVPEKGLDMPQLFTPGTPEAATLEPQGTAENVGYGAEKIAEFLTPSGEINAISKAGQGFIKGTGILSKLGRVGIKAGTEAVSTGAISTAQEGEFNDQAKTNAIVGGLFSLVGSAAGEAIDLLGKGVKKVGKKIQTTVIKPNLADLKDGFKIENLKKYNLGGSNEQVLFDTSNKLNELSDQLNKKLGSSNVSLNLNGIYDETVAALGGSKAKNFGNIKGTERVLESLKNEITEVAGKNGLVSIPEAQLVKQGAGTKGSWVFGSGDPDASAIEKVYNAFYKNLKVAIEKNSPEGVKEINKQISELIPIQNAVLRRIPVESRNSIMSLNDSISLFGSLLNPKALAVLGAGRLSKSGKFGNFLVNISDKVKSPSGSPLTQRIFGQANQESANTNQIRQNIKNPINPSTNAIPPSMNAGSSNVKGLSTGGGVSLLGAIGAILGKPVPRMHYQATDADFNHPEKPVDIIEGYNIGNYATDPEHEKKVQRIYQAVPETGIGEYIKTKFPKSPITEDMVEAASAKFGVPVRLLVAIMQQDSGLGTVGLGVKTRNPGNVGNNDVGQKITYPTWQEGVNGVARFLSKNKAK